MLAVARRCKECGVRLSSLESAFHHCRDALAWPFPDSLASAWPNKPVQGALPCKIIRLDKRLLASASGRAQFAALWEFVMLDLPHSLGEPTEEAILQGTSIVLLAVQAREVIGVLWADVGAANLYLEADGEAIQAAGDEAVMVAADSRRECCHPVNVVLIWVRKVARRQGLATALVDIARQFAAQGRQTQPVGKDVVAFSQPTTQGLAFARHYHRPHFGGKTQLLNSDWQPSC